ncbi:acyl-CoA dehydrogenase [Gordonia amarae]|uniref:Broad-specificity linear acyl-CoA dehydrogenase FadE5 n=2 Tax=Gordonia amarae TaxID=36821 RepID=G7GWM2_9ACTN|nr:acyl-CoA dehydrogenase [Gordonia amarae]MCS3877318.1 alkylation response protein AidB-like acyl-CoA dehydrogenase [Gordonia amarae]QHN16078.1 acyl-CoA dehydrogenase [Gordonia amarae]QHN20646.1 acyl-CoA dehydrogenase [Gordonia amarae]QHN38274.1 acyl-CoA dehydrogenase [Gordonia amarae]GAB07997.1 putative acyl-CoA dehydrogenase [Gordonia amarae NBRC 15530]
MGHYKSNLRDLQFNLFELLNLEQVLEDGDFGDLDKETAIDMLREVKSLSEGVIADSFADADRNPPVFDPETHSVTIPESFKKSYNAYIEAGWDKVGLHEELGGLPAPRSLYWALAEMVLGANPPLFMYSAGSGFADIFYNQATDEQKKWAIICSERGWGSTMVLTEPDAGSDVGAGRTKAVEQEDGTWHIDGVKRFITSADQDMTENIFHLVLARPEGAGPGTKGLSLFFVPKFHFDHETGELGERNGVFVTNVEHKMGIKASATCEVTFGQHGIPAKGWLVGEVHKGIAQMFQVIEHARMMVGTKAISTLSTGYLNALDYAKERVQGADLTQMTDKAAPRVTITHHPDVRRSLMTQKAYAEGLRAVYLYTASHQDAAAAKIVSGADADLAHRVNDLLLPIVKGVGSERAYAALSHESLQTFGGSGFLQDYPIEQYIRDAKIDSLYEGTTAIQAQDFFFRKIVRDRGQAFAHVAGQIQQFLDTEAGNGRLKAERALLKTAVEDVQAMTGSLTATLMSAQEDPKQLYKVGLGSVRYLMAVGDMLIGWLLLRQAEIAIAKLDEGATGEDKSFYEGKVAVASFFAKNMLPLLTSVRVTVENVDNDIMELDEAAF